MTGLIGDLRHALAVYRSTPIASAIAVIALAVAMAFVSAFMAMWSDLSLRPPDGFRNGGDLVTIGQSGGYSVADSSAPLTLDIIEGINESVGSLQFAAGIATFPQLLHQDEGAGQVLAEAVTRRYSELEPRIQLGRLFDAQDHLAQAEPVVILSDRVWQQRFGGRADILGRTLRLTELGPAPELAAQGLPEPRGQDYRIVGVMSARLRGTFGATTDLWLPYEQVVPFLYGGPDEAPQFDLGLTGSVTTSTLDSVPTRMRGLARPTPGTSAAAVGNELNARFEIESQALAQGLDLVGAAIRFDVLEGVIRDIDSHRTTARQVRLFLAGTVLLVVVAACNISLFLLARASRRQRELGIRMAVGASTRRLMRQLATEAGILMLVATALGVLISFWLAAILGELPFLQQAEFREVSPFDWRVLLMLSGLMLLLTLLVSLAPILGLGRAGIKASSGRVTARAGFGQRLAGAVQIALTGTVGAVAVAFAWQLYLYATADRGFDPEDVLVVELGPRSLLASIDATTTQETAIVERQRQRDLIDGLPGVDSASFTTYAPGGAGEIFYTVVQRELGRYVEIATIYIDSHYFDVLGIPIIHGRNVDPNEIIQIVANESYSTATFGRPDAVGETTRTNRTLRGVTRDIAFGHPAEAIPPTGYIVWPRSNYPILLLKTKASPAEMRALLQERIDAGELELELGNIDRLANVAARDLRGDRARTALTATAALLVVVLSAFGFYGTQRYLVTAGQREYAIRSAIGAGPRALGRLVLARSARLALPGLVFGSVLAFVAVAWMREGYFTAAVSPLGVSLMIVGLIVALILLASHGPARQARRTAPAALLRED